MKASFDNKLSAIIYTAAEIWWYGKCSDPGRIGVNILRTGCLTSTTTRGRLAIDVEFQALMSTTLGLIVPFLRVLRGPLECRVGAIPNQGRRNIPDAGEHQYLHTVEVTRNPIWRVSRDKVHVD